MRKPASAEQYAKRVKDVAASVAKVAATFNKTHCSLCDKILDKDIISVKYDKSKESIIYSLTAPVIIQIPTTTVYFCGDPCYKLLQEERDRVKVSALVWMWSYRSICPDMPKDIAILICKLIIHDNPITDLMIHVKTLKTKTEKEKLDNQLYDLN